MVRGVCSRKEPTELTYLKKCYFALINCDGDPHCVILCLCMRDKPKVENIPSKCSKDGPNGFTPQPPHVPYSEQLY